MWPFKKKASTGRANEPQGDLTEIVYTLKTKVGALERELDEQHDFIRRLASRRAKEIQVEGSGRKVARQSPDDDVDEPAESLADRKKQIWERVKAKRG